jgi:hypothetical protein
VYDPTGARVFQQAWDNQSFRVGQARTFKTTWSAPLTAVAGTYTVKIGVYSPGWGTLYNWNGQAGVFTVS